MLTPPVLPDLVAERREFGVHVDTLIRARTTSTTERDLTFASERVRSLLDDLRPRDLYISDEEHVAGVRFEIAEALAEGRHHRAGWTVTRFLERCAAYHHDLLLDTTDRRNPTVSCPCGWSFAVPNLHPAFVEVDARRAYQRHLMPEVTIG